MSPKQIRWFMAAVAVALLLTFLGLYGWEIVQIWLLGAFKWTAEVEQIATMLSGLVGGVTAMIFNERLPDDPQAAKFKLSPKDDGAEATPSASGPKETLEALLYAFIPRTEDLLAIVSVMYVAGYFILALAAIVTWLAHTSADIGLIKNLAWVALGLFVAIAKSFFRVPKA